MRISRSIPALLLSSGLLAATTLTFGISDMNGDPSGATVPLATSSLQITLAGDLLSWTPMTGAVGYDVVRGDLSTLLDSAGNFSLATKACLANDLIDTSLHDPDTPAAGQGFWYVVREVTATGVGSYDSGEPSQVGSRDSGIAASGRDCSVPVNGAPILSPIGAQSVVLGHALSLTLTAVDPIGDPLTFSASPLPLPAHATLDALTGRFIFTPAADQVGSLALTFIVSDGILSDSETVTIAVQGGTPGAPTAFFGRVLDANDFGRGVVMPVVGATISFLGTGSSVMTDASGYFTLTGLPAGKQILDIVPGTGQPAPDGSAYGGFREARDLLEGVTNVESRPFFLPRIAANSLTPVDPNATTVVNNPTLGVGISIPPHTAKNSDGSDFTGMISISEVPRGLAPAPLPDTLEPGLLVTIQPVGVQFASPVPITFPNIDGLTPGSQTDLWSLDPNRGIFAVVGTGQVSSDGMRVETISGGVRAADWHATLPPGGRGTGGGDGGGGGGCSGPLGSSVTLHNGCLGTGFSLPAYASLAELRTLRFSYKSLSASPRPVIPFDATIPVRAAVPPTMSYELRVAGISQSTKTFVDTSGLNENVDETIRAAVEFDAGNFATGAYPYTIRLTSNYGSSRVSSGINDRVAIVNEQRSSFGAGWRLDGLQRLYIQPDHSALLVDGDSTSRLFNFIQLKSGGVAHWPFDDQINPTADVVGGHSGTIVGGGFTTTDVAPVPGNVSALVLNGAGDHVEVANSEDLNFGTGSPMSIAFWFKVTSPAGVFHILGKRDGCGSMNYQLARDGGLLHFNSDGGRLNAGVDYRLNTFMHMAVTYDGVSTLKLYIDAAEVARSDSYTTLVANSAPLEIGASGTCGATFPGVLDDVLIYRRALEPIEVAALAGLTPPPADRLVPPPGDFSTLAQNPDGTYSRTLKDGTRIDLSARGLQTAIVDRNGNSMTYAYDASDRLVSMTDPVGLVTAFSYSGDHLRAVTDPAGRITTFEHDFAGNLTNVIFPNGTARSFAYDARHLMVAETSPRNFVTTRDYDAAGRTIRAILPDGSVRQATAADTVGLVDPSSGHGTLANPAPVRRPSEALSTLTDGEGRITTYSTGSFGEATGITTPSGLTIRVDRDGNGNSTRLSYPSGAGYVRTYDLRGNTLSSTDIVLGGTARMTYEPVFNLPVTVSDFLGQTSTLAYDARGNPLQYSSPLGRTVTAAYDARGLLTSFTNLAATETSVAYDAKGNPIRITAGTGLEQRLATATLTPEGYPGSITDSLGRIFSFAYDALGRVVRQTLADGRVVGFAYDENGNLSSITPPGRPMHTYSHTPVDRLVEYRAPDVGDPSSRTLYAYNLAQQLTRIARPDGRTLDFVYDASGRLTGLGLSRGQVRYGYDKTTGKLTTITAPDGGALSYSYRGEIITTAAWTGAVAGSVTRTVDGNARVTSRGVNGSTVALQYDADGLLTRAGDLALTLLPASGLISGSSLGNVAETWDYNPFGEPILQAASYKATRGYYVQYGRDTLGRITGKTETLGGITDTLQYTYDLAGRLSAVTQNGTTQVTYTYDSNSNRLSRTGPDGTLNGAYDAQDRLTQYGPTTYTYTASGDLHSATTAGRTTVYEYDELGNLVQVALPDGKQIAYVLDGLNRRIGKMINGTLVQGLLFEDSLRPIAELDGSNNVVNRFIYASRANVPDYLVRGGAIFRIIADHLGSPRLVIGAATGAIAQRMDYDEFGNVLRDSNPGFQPFGFAGGIYDRDTGLTRFGARDYNAYTGRWTAKDPIGFNVFDPNLYVYAKNDPVNFVDPTGLQGTAWGAGLEIPILTTQTAGTPAGSQPNSGLDPDNLSGILFHKYDNPYGWTEFDNDHLHISFGYFPFSNPYHPYDVPFPGAQIKDPGTGWLLPRTPLNQLCTESSGVAGGFKFTIEF